MDSLPCNTNIRVIQSLLFVYVWSVQVSISILFIIYLLLTNTVDTQKMRTKRNTIKYHAYFVNKNFSFEAQIQLHVNEKCRHKNEFRHMIENLWKKKLRTYGLHIWIQSVVLLKVWENAFRRIFKHIDQQLHGRFFCFVLFA